MKQKLLKTMLLLCALVVGSGNVWADPWTYTFNASSGVSKGDKTLNGVSWNIDHDSGYENNEAAGFHVGSSSKTVSYLELSTSGISGTISKIVVNAKGNGTGGTISVSVGGNAYTAKVTSITNTATDFEFTGSSSGTIVIRLSYASAVKKNFYVTSITVTYVSGYTVTYNGNGATSGIAPSDATVYSKDAEVTVLGQSTLEKTRYAFGGWNTKADGTGTNYDENDTFTITASTTLYAKWVPYVITAVSSNDSYGTVSLDGFVITGSPESGYRYASPAYSVTSGSADVSQEGNEFTVTPTSDCTVRINYEAIPTHTITCVADPVGAGTFDAVSSLYEGGTTSVKATANPGYKFTGWSISGTGASLSSTSTNPTTVTMGTADATVTATFEAVETHAITYSVNGATNTVNVEEDAAVDLSAPVSGIPTGYYFKGWRTSTLAVTDTDPDDYVTSATSTADITYYAVMAVRTASSPDTYEKLDNNSFDSKATYVIGGVQGGTGGDGTTIMYLSAYSAVDADLGWGTCTSTPSTVAPVTFTLSGTAAALVAKDNSDNYLAKSSEVKKFAMSSTSKTIYLDTDGSIKTASDGWRMRYNHNNGSGGLRLYDGTTGQQAYFYKVIDNNTYGSYCTTIPPVSVTVSDASYATFACDYPLDFTDKDIDAYIAITKGDGTGVTFRQINKVPANTGVLLHYKGGKTEEIPVFDGTGADATTGNKFVRGTGEKVLSEADSKKNYILFNGSQGLGFYGAGNQTVAKDKAYISISASESAAVKGFIALPGFEETAVEAVKAEAENGVIFNLAGQRIQKLQRGINIINGKKVVVK